MIGGRLLSRFRRKPAPVDQVGPDWLEVATGYNAVRWVEWIQHQINSTWRDNPDDPKHPLCVPVDDWLIPLVEQVSLCLKRRGAVGDPNIGHALAISMILAAWGGRIARAKAMDPHRPVKLRQGAYWSWRRWVSWMMDTLVDESRDPEFFAGQPWESPFLPDATDGDFV